MALTDEGIVFVPGLLSRWVRLPSGARAHYMTSGETGPAVVLLHGGLPGSSGTAGWRLMAPFLGASGFRVYCPDMPGFGLCDIREEHRPAGLESHVDFLHEFVDALCLDRFHLAGNSMGCINAVNYLCAHPDRVLSYALIAGFVGDVAPLRVQPKVGPEVLSSFDGSESSMRGMLEKILHRPDDLDPELVTMRTETAKRNVASYAAMPPSLLSYALALDADPNIGARLRTKDRFERLTLPGICLYGRDDVLVPVEQGHLQEDALPKVQFFYPDDCGHQGQTDQPEMFNQVFLEFFKDGKITRKTADWAGISDRRPEIPGLVD